DPFAPASAEPFTGARPTLLQRVSDAPWRHWGDTRERLELLAAQLLAQRLAQQGEENDSCQRLPSNVLVPMSLKNTDAALDRVLQVLAPRLDACGSQELHQFSQALRGRFVPPGRSGSPSRGRPDVLPNGR